MLKENLSAYMDGERHNFEYDEFAKILCKEEELQESWTAYHLARAIIKNEASTLLGADFTAKMASIIDEESSDHLLIAQPAPDEIQASPFAAKFKSLLAPLTQIAVAASVCLVAVIGVQSFSGNSNSAPVSPVLQTLPFNNSVQQVSYKVSNKDTPSKVALETQDKRIAGMLQNYELQRRMSE